MSDTHEDHIVVEARGLKTHFGERIGLVAALLGKTAGVARALDGVDIAIRSRRILGLVGESGCGKSTLGMTLVRMHEPTEGEIRFAGEPVTHASGRALKTFRGRAQIIFQDPYSSLNPRLTVGQIIEEPLKIHGIGTYEDRPQRIARALDHVRMPAEDYLDRYPSDLSGGQRQRVAIARALVMEPSFIVADEPVSMLDVSIQAGVLELLDELSRRLGLAVLYISHDIATVGYICDEVAVMYSGRIVEQGPTRSILSDPHHPYSMSLMAAIPRIDGTSPRNRVQLSGEVPSPLNIPPGCRFASRCAHAAELCRATEPDLYDAGGKRRVRCHLYAPESTLASTTLTPPRKTNSAAPV